MIKAFCDMCAAEITDVNRCKGGKISAERLGTSFQRNNVKVKAEVLITKNETANAGDFCKYCVLDALYKLDDRPCMEALNPESPSHDRPNRPPPRTAE